MNRRRNGQLKTSVLLIYPKTVEKEKSSTSQKMNERREKEKEKKKLRFVDFLFSFADNGSGNSEPRICFELDDD